jgi:hypothetical protein
MLTSQQSRPAPTDYTGRSVKVRLFAGLAVIMFLAAVLELKAWRWPPVFQNSRKTAEPISTRLDDSGLRTAHDPLGTFVAIGGHSSPVRDDTAILRPAEREAWFETVRQVRDADKETLRESSLGRIAYLQLFKQPDEYRGKVVTVVGTVRLAYRVPALANELGVKEYFVYWVQPVGSPDSPIVVYALEAPHRFPGMGTGAGGPSAGKLHEDVEVTGIFFKRAAYAAQGGTHTAPLIIAKVPAWRPEAPARNLAEIPVSPFELTAFAVAALLLAICVGAVLWKRSARRNRFGDSTSAGEVIGLGSVIITPPTDEFLRNFDSQARGGDKS